MEIFLNSTTENGLTNSEINTALLKAVENKDIKKVLIIPPDATRLNSNAGYITNFYYTYFTSANIEVDILPALGTHDNMSRDECSDMFGNIPYSVFIHHNWRKDIVNIGKISKEKIYEITEGNFNESLNIEVNKLVLDKSYNLILSLGQVVPHEVIGMANHSKNIFVGVGGSEIINKSHMIGAIYGMEKMMGKDHSPVRKIFDYALKEYLNDLPLIFVLTVTTTKNNSIRTNGLFIGNTRKTLEEAIKVSQKLNINYLEKPIQKCIVYLDEHEFKSTWLGNKAIYRTKMAMAKNGELIILARGIKKFGEDLKIDDLIRKYGYRGKDKLLELYNLKDELKDNMGAVAHLIHGSTDGKFKVIYAVENITKEEIENVGYCAADYSDIIKKYPFESFNSGYNTINNEVIYFIKNPAIGLWMLKE